MTTNALVFPKGSNSLTSYYQQISRFPILEEKEEYMLAKRYIDYGDLKAAHKLTTSYLRLAFKVAMSYRHYGLPVKDLISEANIGLMKAVKKFDPEKGNRLSTYAVWWIRAAISEFILKTWSLVKIGTVATQKRLFYNLHKIKAKLGLYDATSLDDENVGKIADILQVSEKEVKDMDARLGRDLSLNAPVSDEQETEQQNLLVDETQDFESRLAENEEESLRKKALYKAIETLSDREQEIIKARYLQEPNLTLDELGQQFHISRERVRQIEARAYQKIAEILKKQIVQN
ncbi:MAG: sigma-70 family RNA polymerase sigma factor [Alphaproteobacteria bacterium]|nr:sigma-70 family RNA polymerase sigma factor [Alphaproteobacteria bacterium]